MNDEADRENAEWLRTAVERHAAELLRYAASIVRDADVARDIVQETFVRLWIDPPQALAERRAAWLFRVCRNRALDHLRKESRMTPLPANSIETTEDQTPENPALAAETNDSHHRLLQMMETLPSNQREVVRLKFQSGLSYKEIAEITDLSVTNVGFLLHTALKTLRTRLLAAGE